MTPDRRAAIVGRKVLQGLARGRQIANAQAQARSRALAEQILTLAAMDMASTMPSRGRPGRIARKMGGVTERHVKRILDMLSCSSELRAHSEPKQEARHHV